MATLSKSRQEAVIADLTRRKSVSRTYLRSLPLAQKLEELERLQENYYSMLELREKTGGKPIPERWRKWRETRDQAASTRTE